MQSAKTLFKAAFGAGSFFRPAVVEAQASGRAADHHPYVPPVLLPIRSIGPRERGRVLKHLLELSSRDRYLRFGYAATDEHVLRYVHSLDFTRDELFGIYNRRLELIAMAHLAFSVDPSLASCAEFGVSVAEHTRGRGYGARLFERAVVHARNEGVSVLFIHALSENIAMLKIARRGGATVEREGSEAEAYLRLPPATLDSRMAEIVQEQVARTDYHWKAQARQFRALLQGLQEVRRGVQDARKRSGR